MTASPGTTATGAGMISAAAVGTTRRAAGVTRTGTEVTTVAGTTAAEEGARHTVVGARGTVTGSKVSNVPMHVSLKLPVASHWERPRQGVGGPGGVR